MKAASDQEFKRKDGTKRRFKAGEEITPEEMKELGIAPDHPVFGKPRPKKKAAEKKAGKEVTADGQKGN